MAQKKFGDIKAVRHGRRQQRRHHPGRQDVPSAQARCADPGTAGAPDEAGFEVLPLEDEARLSSSLSTRPCCPDRRCPGHSRSAAATPAGTTGTLASVRCPSSSRRRSWRWPGAAVASRPGSTGSGPGSELLEERQLTPDGAPSPRSRRARGAGPLGRPARRAQGRVAALGGRARAPRPAALGWGGCGPVAAGRPTPASAPPRAPAPRGPGRPRGRRACEVVASLYRRLHVPAPPQLVTSSRRGGPTRWVRSARRRCRAPAGRAGGDPGAGAGRGRGHRRPAAAHRPALRERARR